MAQRLYATPSDYDALAEESFDGDNTKLTKRLRAASIEVEKLVRFARYDTDDDGYPTDDATSEAFTEATCAIVEHWGITDDPTGAEATLGAIKIGSVSLGTTSSRESSGDSTESRIGSKAMTILSNARLASFLGY